MLVPNNYTESQVLEIIESVISKIAYKFVFGSYTLDDIKQEARIIAINGLKKYDNKRQLENFLYIHVKNRLINFKRDHYIRLPEKCKKCKDFSCDKCLKREKSNTSKRHLAHSNSYEDSDNNMSFDIYDLDVQEIKTLIDQNLPIELRADYIRMTNGVTVSNVKKLEILRIIKEIINA